MLGQQFATILAQTDPFDVAQGLERYIRSLSGEQIRTIIRSAETRMNDWYRAEFMPLVDEPDGRINTAFAHALKSNLRAIPLFGPAFCEGIIAQVPGDRAIALGEEGYRFGRVKPVAFGIVAVALLIAGAAGEHVYSTARANAQAPAVVFITPPPLAAAPAPTPHAPRVQPTRIAAAARPAARPAATAAPPTAAPATEPPTVTTPDAATPAAAAAPARALDRTPRPDGTPRPGAGVKTVVVEPTPAPTAEPTSPDVSDMPQAFTDATPLPRDATAPPPQIPVAHVATPTPGPNRSWTHRLVHLGVHLVNTTLTTIGVAKKPPKPTPSASPSGPQP